MRSRGVWVLVGLAAIAVVVWALRHRAAAQTQRATGAREAAAQDRPVPVLVAAVEQRDVPIYLEGLGTVAAYNTVTVRTRVDGRLDAVLFREGQTVHRGDVLARVDARPYEIALRQAQAVAARDRAQLAASRTTLARNRTLQSQSYIAQQDVDTAAGNTAALEASVRGDEAQIASARLSLDFARITSPIDGVTGLRLVDAGNMVHPGDATGIVVVAQIDPISVVFSLPQDALSSVSAQMARGPLTVDVFSRDGLTQIATGQLAVLDNQINANTATLRLKAVFANPNRALWPDQFVKTRLHLDTRRGALVAPATAIQRGPQGTFVYVVTGDQRVAIRPVQIERIEGESALLSGGVNAGEQVVTEGQTRLRAGARVQPRPAAGGGGDAGAPQGGAGRGQGRGQGRGGRGRGDAGA